MVMPPVTVKPLLAIVTPPVTGKPLLGKLNPPEYIFTPLVATDNRPELPPSRRFNPVLAGRGEERGDRRGGGGVKV